MRAWRLTLREVKISIVVHSFRSLLRTGAPSIVLHVRNVLSELSESFGIFLFFGLQVGRRMARKVGVEYISLRIETTLRIDYARQSNHCSIASHLTYLNRCWKGTCYKLSMIFRRMTRNFSPGQSRWQWRIMDISSTEGRKRENEGRRTRNGGRTRSAAINSRYIFHGGTISCFQRPHNRHKLRKNTVTYKLRRNRRARRQVRYSPGSNLSESLSRSLLCRRPFLMSYTSTSDTPSLRLHL